MSEPYSQIVSYFQKKKIALSDYAEYLTLCPLFKKVSQSLTQQNIILKEYLKHLEKQPISTTKKSHSLPFDSKTEDTIEKIGQALLEEKRLTLFEINCILRSQKTLEIQTFLQQLLRLRKITIEEFVAFSRLHSKPSKNSSYPLKREPPYEFYVKVSERIQKYGPYIVLEEIGRGGMGVVYKAYHEQLNRVVALKILIAGSNASEKIKQRFRREIEMMAHLQHEGIVQIYDSGEQDNDIYLAMEYVEGNSLNKISTQINLQEKVRLIQQTLQALYYAHQMGIIHRDLKLENILVTSDQTPKIADFGLAKKTFEDIEKPEKPEQLTQNGTVLGTAIYMAPEQARGEVQEIDTRSDLYAIGVCLYFLLTSRFPHEEKSFQKLLHHIIHADPTPPSKYFPQLHRDLEAILLKVLEKEKTARYSSALDFAEDLERFLNGVPVEALQSDFKIKRRKWFRKHKKALFFGFFLFLTLLFSGITQVFFASKERDQLFQKTYQRVLEKISTQQINSSKNSMNTYLSAWNQIHEALQIYPHHAEAEQQKWNIGKQILDHSLQAETHSLGDYIFQEMQQLSSIPEQVRQKQKEEWELQKNKQWKQEEIRFQQWLKDLQKEPFDSKQGEDALYEIIKMSFPTLNQKLLAEFQTAHTFFTVPPEISIESKSPYYLWIIRVLAKRKRREPLSQICESLTFFLKDSKTTHTRPLYQIHYLVELAKYLWAIRAYEQIQLLQDLRVLTGEHSLFWKRTKFITKKLYQQKLAQEDQSALLESVEAYAIRAQKKRYSGFLLEAIEDLNYALQKSPNYAEAYNNRGLIKKDLQDFNGALLDFNEAIRLKPHFSEVYHNRGSVRKALNDSKGAITDYSEAIRLNPQYAQAYNNRGVVKRMENDFQAAISDYNEAIRLNPQYAEAYNNRANSKHELEDFEGAISDFDEAIRLDPQYARCYNNRGRTRSFQKNFNGAIEDYNEAIHFDPKFVDAYYNRGLLKHTLKDFEGAINDFSKVILLEPKYAEAYNNRGVVKNAKRAWQEAIKDYTEAIRIHPQYFEAYFNRANVKRILQDIEGSIADYSEVIRLNPQLSSAYFNRGMIYLQSQKNPRQAKEDFKHYLELLKTKPLSPQDQKSILFIKQQFPELQE